MVCLWLPFSCGVCIVIADTDANPRYRDSGSFIPFPGAIHGSIGVLLSFCRRLLGLFKDFLGRYIYNLSRYYAENALR